MFLFRKNNDKKVKPKIDILLDSSSSSEEDIHNAVSGTLDNIVRRRAMAGGNSRRERLVCIFKLFDKDQDGFLSQSEVRSLLSSVYSTNLLEEIIGETEGIKISLSEFLEMCSSGSVDPLNEDTKDSNRKKSLGSEIYLRNGEYTESELREVFQKVFDSNEDGVITKSELFKILQNLGISSAFSEIEIGELFGSVGQKDTITFEQFKQLLD
ncbi:hypothetical protein ABK040_014388 [Willaertia magna]